MVEVLAPEDLEDDWSELSASALAPGSRLGRYELLIPIAYGGMARVWAARQHGTRGFTKLVAIKTILPHLANDPEFERMFLDEARIAAGVHHPNVCQIHDLGEEGHVLYIAMEWVNGDSLIHVLRGGKPRATRIDPRLAARIVADACAGLDAAHNLTDDEGRSMAVVHRDVSPHNILVSQSGTVKVADFGVAKALGQIHQTTAAGQVKGKVSYMAPEHVACGPIDRRSDVYAMGCVLYEATLAMVPFRGEADLQIMQAVAAGCFDAPSLVLEGYPPELEEIVMCALARDPNARFATAGKMRLALEQWLVKSGPLVTEADVGALVRERLGPMLDKRQQHIRSASNVSERERDSGARPAASPNPRSGVVVTGTAHEAPRPSSPPLAETRIEVPRPSNAGFSDAPVETDADAPPGGVRYAAAVLVGIAAAGILAGVGFAAWRATDTAPAAQPPAAIAPVKSEGRAPAAVATIPPSTPSWRAAITFLVAPDDAVLIVDGKPQAKTVRTVARPATGKTTTLVVHADGFDDQKFTVDDNWPDKLDVVLMPVEKRGMFPPGAIGAGVPRASVSGPESGKSAKSGGATAPPLPENPY